MNKPVTASKEILKEMNGLHQMILTRGTWTINSRTSWSVRVGNLGGESPSIGVTFLIY